MAPRPCSPAWWPAILALWTGMLLSSGCRHRGSWERSPQAPPAADLQVVVLGQAREARSTQALARELQETLARTSAPGRQQIVLWLGTDIGRPGTHRAPRCPASGTVFTGPHLSALQAALSQSEVDVWGLPGPDGWRCGLDDVDAALPYRQPGLSYVLRVDAGQPGATLVSSCDAKVCSLDSQPSPDTVAELVMLDFSPWLFPELLDVEALELVEAQQASLLAALAQSAGSPDVPEGVARILVTPIPVDSAGRYGYGGRLQRASFRYLPPSIREAIADGLFVGVLGGLERSLQVSADISGAIVRSDRSFVARPLFQVVSGSAGGASMTAPTSRGRALSPEIESEHLGFAQVFIHAALAEIRVHARVGGRWRVAGEDVQLDRPPHEQLRPVPPMTPCRDCDPVNGAADGAVWIPRPADRPR